MSSELSASVVVITYNRPDHVTCCLENIQAQTTEPREVVVVDASTDGRTREVVRRRFPTVVYLRNELGAGTMGHSRLIGVGATTSDVVAFLDDDAFADSRWLEKIVEQYADQSVGAVGGRALNGQLGEESQGSGQIGMLLPNGTLTGNFAADPGRPIKVDHLLGANMSYRMTALADIGGIRTFYPGTCLREDSDTSLRVRNRGWRVIYEPAAVVRHVAGPYAKGKRFDRRYLYYGARNHVVLLSQVCGLRSQEFRYFHAVAFRQANAEVKRSLSALLRPRRPYARSARAVVGGGSNAVATLAGLVAGLGAALSLRLSPPKPGRPR